MPLWVGWRGGDPSSVQGRPSCCFGAELRCFGIPGLCYVPKGERAHAFDERTSLDDLRRCTLTIAVFIADWSGTAPR